MLVLGVAIEFWLPGQCYACLYICLYIHMSVSTLIHPLLHLHICHYIHTYLRALISSNTLLGILVDLVIAAILQADHLAIQTCKHDVLVIFPSRVVPAVDYTPSPPWG